MLHSPCFLCVTRYISQHIFLNLIWCIRFSYKAQKTLKFICKATFLFICSNKPHFGKRKNIIIFFPLHKVIFSTRKKKSSLFIKRKKLFIYFQHSLYEKWKCGNCCLHTLLHKLIQTFLMYVSKILLENWKLYNSLELKLDLKFIFQLYIKAQIDVFSSEMKLG